MRPHLQRFYVEAADGRFLGEVAQLPDGRWAARLSAAARPFATFDRPADADAAVRRARLPLERQGAVMV